jgi:hypothetical protein
VPRSACIFTYIFEITPDKYHTDVTLWVYLGDGITFVISGLFIMYTRNVYMFLNIICVTTIVAVLVLMWYLPESPKFLYAKKRYEDLQANFEMMKKMNRCRHHIDVPNMVE